MRNNVLSLYIWFLLSVSKRLRKSVACDEYRELNGEQLKSIQAYSKPSIDNRNIRKWHFENFPQHLEYSSNTPFATGDYTDELKGGQLDTKYELDKGDFEYECNKHTSAHHIEKNNLAESTTLMSIMTSTVSSSSRQVEVNLSEAKISSTESDFVSDASRMQSRKTVHYMEGNPSRSNSELKNNVSQPVELLCRIFPYIKFDSLQSCIDRCNGDILLTIERLTNHYPSPLDIGEMHNTLYSQQSDKLFSSFFCPRSHLGTSIPYPAHSTTSTFSPFSPMNLLTLPGFAPPTRFNGVSFKSAFSPVTQPPRAHINSVRYLYASPTTPSVRGSLLPFTSPLATYVPRGYGYN